MFNPFTERLLRSLMRQETTDAFLRPTSGGAHGDASHRHGGQTRGTESTRDKAGATCKLRVTGCCAEPTGS